MKMLRTLKYVILRAFALKFRICKEILEIQDFLDESFLVSLDGLVVFSCISMIASLRENLGVRVC